MKSPTELMTLSMELLKAEAYDAMLAFAKAQQEAEIINQEFQRRAETEAKKDIPPHPLTKVKK